MRRPYFFEIFAVVNLAIIQLLLWPISFAPTQSLPGSLAILVPAFLVQVAIGVAIRAVVAWRQGRLADYLGIVRSRSWLADTARIVISSALFVHTYGWIKLAIPVLHPRLFDQQLWDIDRAMFFGHSPNVLFLDVFSNAMMLRFFDWTYANVFLASLYMATVFFTSAPDQRLRIGFVNSNTAMWIIGAWLYVLTPSLGPAYRFPDLWLPLSAALSRTQELQRILMNNYQNILRRQPINIFYGIAAFPSLHVAFEMLVLLWMRRVWRLGAMIFAVTTVIIFLGSVVTGWHYLVDSIAGIVLAVLCYLPVAIAERRHTLSVACLS